MDPCPRPDHAKSGVLATAIYARSTTAHAVQPRLFRGGGTVPCQVLTPDEVIALTAEAPALPITFTFRSVPPVDDPRSAVEVLDEIRRTIEGQESCHRDTPSLFTASAALPVSGDVNSATVADLAPDYPDPIGVAEDRPDEIRLADAARILHLRRQLAVAAEHGAALLAALGLPASSRPMSSRSTAR